MLSISSLLEAAKNDFFKGRRSLTKLTELSRPACASSNGSHRNSPLTKLSARGEAPARVLCRQRPHRGAAGGDGGRARRLPQRQCRGRVTSADRRVRGL